jgi:hypothetical protein
MKIYILSVLLPLLFCNACQGPSVSHDKGHIESDTTNDSLNQVKSKDSTSLSGKKDLSFSKLLQMGKINFHVYSPNNALHNSIIIQPAGLKDNSLIQTGVIGNVNDAFIGDLNKDGFPEIYYTVVTEQGQKNLFGYGSNKNINLSPVYMADIREDKKWGAGYRGRDEYKISGDRLIRSFPVYAPSDPASSPSAGIRLVNYRLVQGINGWLLKVVGAKDKVQ